MPNEKRNAKERANYHRRMAARGYVGYVDRTPTPEAIQKAAELNCGFVMLGHGHFALVDHDDLQAIGQHRWTKHKKGYAVRMAPGEDRRQIGLKMHRVILEAKEGQICDHRNRNRLDNRRCNLRFCTIKESNFNKGKRTVKRGATSLFKGVSFDPTRRAAPWVAQVRKDGVNVFVSNFKTEVEAAAAYNAAAIRWFGEFAAVNSL